MSAFDNRIFLAHHANHSRQRIRMPIQAQRHLITDRHRLAKLRRPHHGTSRIHARRGSGTFGPSITVIGAGNTSEPVSASLVGVTLARPPSARYIEVGVAHVGVVEPIATTEPKVSSTVFAAAALHRSRTASRIFKTTPLRQRRVVAAIAPIGFNDHLSAPRASPSGTLDWIAGHDSVYHQGASRQGSADVDDLNRPELSSTRFNRLDATIKDAKLNTMEESGVGNDLRLAREAARVSLSGMAKRTGLSRSHLGNVETGKRTATPEVILAYERALGCTVQRRGLVSGIAATIVAPIVAKELIRAGFATALADHPSSDQWEERIIAYGQDYMTRGAAQLQDQLAGDLVVLQQSLETPRLWALAARALTMLGKVSSNPREAVAWYQLANQAADRSNDEATRVWVSGRGALALAYEGARPDVAATLAARALGVSDRPSLGRLNGLLAQAHVFGLQNRRRESLLALEDAQRVFDRVGSAEQISDFAIPEWRMNVISSLLLARIGAEKRATAAQDIARTLLPQQLPRFATHLELHRGLMLVRSGDKTEGIALAEAALAKLPKEKHSQSLRLMMSEIRG